LLPHHARTISVLTSQRTNTISMTTDQYSTVPSDDDDDEDDDDYVNNNNNAY
jgi:hypothetical protein